MQLLFLGVHRVMRKNRLLRTGLSGLLTHSSLFGP